MEEAAMRSTHRGIVFPLVSLIVALMIVPPAGFQRFMPAALADESDLQGDCWPDNKTNDFFNGGPMRAIGEVEGRFKESETEYLGTPTSREVALFSSRSRQRSPARTLRPRTVR